jgi:hypothetical protein
LAFQGETCTWSPPWEPSNPAGGCCPEGEKWNSIEQICGSTEDICNPIVDGIAIFWSPMNQLFGTNTWLNPSKNVYDTYCAKVSRDSSIGLKYRVSVY